VALQQRVVDNLRRNIAMLGQGVTKRATLETEADPKKDIENKIRQKVAKGEKLTPEETNYINTFMKGTKGEYVPPEVESTGGGLRGFLQNLGGRFGQQEPELGGQILGGGATAQPPQPIINMLMQKLSGGGGTAPATPVAPATPAGGVMERLKAALGGAQKAPAIGFGKRPTKPTTTLKQKTGKRQAAIKELKAANAPVTEANIKAAMAQLGQ